MPSVSRAQQRLMGADLARARAGKKTRTGMGEAQLQEYASTPRKGLPARKGQKGKAQEGPHRGKGSTTKATKGHIETHRMPGGQTMRDSEMRSRHDMSAADLQDGGTGNVDQEGPLGTAKEKTAAKPTAFEMVRRGLQEYHKKG